MYLRRKIDDYLKEWKNSEERKPLIIKGARQIGKTESIRKFAEENYTSVIEINFFSFFSIYLTKLEYSNSLMYCWRVK